MRTILVLVLSMSTANAYSEALIEYPVKGKCGELYWRLEGVCVHPTAMLFDAREMKDAIDKFKKTGALPSTEKLKAEQAMSSCERHKMRLAKYQLQGVWGVNFETSRIEKIEGEAALEVIASAQQNVAIFCGN